MAETRHILITGGSGQVGQSLARLAWPKDIVIHAPTRGVLDLGDPNSIRSFFDTTSIAGVINGGAYTAVDKAESEVTAAFLANAMGPAALAEETRLRGLPLIQVSTDYVFDGRSPAPYLENDAVAPLGVYGASKLAGELAARSGNPRSVVLRTAWVLSPYGSNFLKTMLRLATDRPAIRVVSDQYGCPTSAHDIARALQTIALRMIDDPAAPTGVYHFVNSGRAGWDDLAREIFRLSAENGGAFAEVESITSDQYPTPARRPSNSCLATAELERDYGIIARPWQSAVADIVNELVKRIEK
jgi:dTDP-4-dehydrorhamnose reductase